MMELRWNAARLCIRRHWPNRICIILFNVLFASVGPDGLCYSQNPIPSTPETTAVESKSLSVEEAAFRELTIAVAADLDSPAHTRAAKVIHEQAIISDRFNAPIRQAIRTADTEPFDESRLLAAIALMPASTIPRQEQIAIVLDTLVVLSNRETSLGRQLKSGLLTDGPRASGLLDLIVARLTAMPERLAIELEGRFKQGKQPAVIYSLLPLSNSHGSTLVPYVLQAGKDEDRFVKSSAFIALRKAFTNAETASIALMKQRFRSDAEHIFSRNDVDQNGILMPAEWSTMLVNPVAADVDGDSRITLEEYIDWFARRKITQMQNSQ
ncbi:MAG TPA: hypothetical protein DDZ51_30580 [Planctomycetaceae bacterium]|nr:hypothetical protein [Planctomycetaceae bacterium]